MGIIIHHSMMFGYYHCLAAAMQNGVQGYGNYAPTILIFAYLRASL